MTRVRPLARMCTHVHRKAGRTVEGAGADIAVEEPAAATGGGSFVRDGFVGGVVRSRCG